MRWLRLALCLLLFVPAWTLLGGWSTFDSGMPLWWGMAVGGAFGLLTGLAFGGNSKWRFWDSIFGPEVPDERDED